MGSYPYPRSGVVKIDYENILLFKKLGKSSAVSKEAREKSELTDEEWNTYFSSHWTFSGAKQNGHIAVFPEELPKRLIKMFSFVGDTVLDPFMGSGTTALAAYNLQRNSIGYEINPAFKQYYWQKVMQGNIEQGLEFISDEDHSPLNLNDMMSSLPYFFTDKHQLNKQVDIKANTYGSVVEDKKVATQSAMVLINHARKPLRERMIETGICYLRAGASKGSVLVTPGFERMQYVLLHTSGENCQLFKLKNRGKFQIWTKETLEQYGFQPEHATYYIVLPFDNHPIPIDSHPNLNENKNTYTPKIISLKEIKLKE